MRKLVRRAAVAAVLCVVSFSLFAQTTYTWNQTGGGVWTVDTNWTPTRMVPATNDVLVFNNGSTQIVTGVPVQTIGQLSVSGNTSITLQAAAAGTLTIGGGAGTDLTVAAGSQLNVSGTNALIIALSSGVTGSISGNMTFTNAAHKLTAASASGVTFNNGAIFTAGTGFTNNAFNNTGTTNSIIFASGSKYISQAGANPFGSAGGIAQFQTGSLYSHQQSGAPSFSGRTYADYEQNFNGTFSVTGGSAVVMDNLTILQGTLNYGMTNASNAIKGSISISSGATLNFNPATVGTVTFNGTSAQSITNNGTFSVSTTVQTLALNNSSGLTLNSNIAVANGAITLTSGNITVASGKTLSLGSNVNITRTSGHVIGNLKKTFAGAGSKTFEVGTTNGYSPVTANVISGTGDLTISATQGAHPNVTASTSIARYWTLTATGLTADLTFQYLAGDVSGNESNYQLARINGGTPTFFPATVISTGSHTASLAGVSSFSDWTVGEGADTTPPAVTSVSVPANGTYVAGQNLDFTVNFSEAVTVDTTGGTPRIPITLNTGGTVYATYVSGSGSTALLFRYTVATGNDDPDGISVGSSFEGNGGTIRDAANNDALTALNSVGGTANVKVDAVAPNVSSITRVNTDPTSASSVDFTVTFDSAVSGVDTSDFSLTTTGITGASVTNVNPTNASVYVVTVSTGSGATGTLRLDVNNGASIQDLAGNALASGFTGGQSYTIDRNTPGVQSITRADLNPSRLASVKFSVAFTQDVTGVDSTDFALTTTGVTGTSIIDVTGSGSSYLVTVNTGSGDGTIRLDVINNGSIQSTTAVPLGSGFTGGEVFTIDKTGPTVVSITRANANPTFASSVDFTVTFSESVSNLGSTDFSLTTTGVSGASISNVFGNGTTHTVSVNTGSGEGTIRLDAVTGGGAHDSADNPVASGFNGGETYTIDRTAPTVQSIVRADSDPSSASSVNFTVTFSEAVTGVGSADFSLVASGLTGTSISGVTGSGTTWTVTANTGSGDGTLGLNLVDDDSITDLAANPLGGTGSGNGNFTGQVYTVDKNAPTVVSINRQGAATQNLTTLNWTLTFSEGVTGVDASDLALVTTGSVSGASITNVTGSGTSWLISVNSGSGDGTIGVNLVDDDSIVDGTSKPLGGAGTGNGNFTGQTITIDKTAPSVVSINRASSTPTTAASVGFTVTFSESVTGVNAADFAVAATGLSGSAITNVTGSGTTYTVTVTSGTGTGTLGLNLVDDDSISDAVSNPLGGSGAGNGNFTGQTYSVNRASATHVVISQVYGGGGNSGANYKQDFIELFNPTGATVSLAGWSVQYSSAAGTSWQVTNLTGSIAPGHYYLVQEAQGAGGSTNLPAPEATGTIAMAGTAAKVALVNQTTALTGSCPSGVAIIDFVGYGSTASCSETAPTATLSNTTSASRVDNGCTDTGNNSTDFTAGAVNPRNGASAPWSCGSLVGSGSASPSTVGASATTLLTVAVTPAQSPASTGLTVTGDLTPIGGSSTQTFYDDGSNGDVTPGDNTFSYNATVGAATTSGGKTLNVAITDAQSRSGAATISLTVLGATNPSATGTATPASVAPNQNSLLTAAVTGGQNPTSTGLAVTADLTSIGGSATQTLFDDGTNGDVTIGDGTFSFLATVAGATPLGGKTLPLTITDLQGRTGSSSISLNVQSASAPPAPTNLIATPGNAQVSLAWDASAGATGYNVLRGTAHNGPYSSVATGVATNNFLDTLVSNGTRYYYVVTAVNASAESGPSNEANALPAAPAPSGSIAKIYFVDIGQGASTLIVSPTGKTLLVDGGPTGQGTAKIVPLLNTLGISTIDYTILTHYHIDHDDGLTETINAGRVAGTSYDNGDTAPLSPPNAGGTKNAYLNYIGALSSHSGTITRVRPEDVGGSLAGQVIDLGGGMKATILAQGGKLLSGGSIAIDNSDLNTESISTLIEYGNFDFLVSGDLTGGGSTSTAKTPDVETFVGQLSGDIDVVEYDHHGSTTANNPKFLRLLKAEAAVAECGYTNTFGHPNRETVNKYLNIPASNGNSYGGTSLPNPGSGPVSYQTDPSPATDDRVTRQGYSGAAPADAGNGTILLKTDGTSSFTMESFEDAGVRLSAASHAYSLDASGSGVTTNFPPTVIPSINPVVPLATDAVLVQAMVNDREDPITSVTLNYSLNGAAQAPVAMTLNGGLYEATIAPQPNGTRVDYSVTAVAGGKSTAYPLGYFSGTTPIATLRVLDAKGEPLYLDYAARISGTATSDTGAFSVGTNDDYIQDATGGINIWRTIQPSTPAVQTMITGNTYTVAGRIGELAGRFHLETTPPFASLTTPYTITQTGSGSATTLVKTIAQLNANPESFEGLLVQINNCTITSGTIPSSPASADAFITISDGTGTFQLKVDKDTDVPGMTTPAGSFTVVGILQQDDFLRPFDSGYDIAPRSRTDLGGSSGGGPGVISIAAARIDVDGSGNSPGDYIPDLLGQTVHVQGVVTSIDFRGGNGVEYYIQDPTGGIDIFNSTVTNSFNIGDNVDVIGTMTHFFGLSEIDPGTLPSHLQLLTPGTLPAVSPTLITTGQLGDNGVGEAQEGKLVRINNVTLVTPPATWAANTNYNITDGTNVAQIRIDGDTNLVGQAPPAGTFSIVGVVGQHSTNQSTPPFDLGYQLLPRFTADLLPAVPTAASISATAGTPQSATIGAPFAVPLQATVLDAGNAPISGAGVTFTAPSSGASGTFAGGSTTASVITDGSGVATAPAFTANATTGGYSVTATSGAVQTSFSLTNVAQSATHFAVSAPASVTSGVPFNVTVTAQNASNGTVTSYSGTVHFSSSANGTLPSDYTFTGGDNGSHTFSVTLTSLGSQSIDAGDGSISGSANLTVSAPSATHFSVTAPANVTAGVAFNVTVTALDSSNATVTGYTGTVHFTSSSAGTLPSDYTFVGGDSGAHTFSVTLTTLGMQSVNVGDGSINGSASTTVSAAPHFSVTAPANAGAGAPFNVTVTALDGADATLTSYSGTVHFTSTSAGTLPSDYTFVAGDNGVHTFSVTLTAVGSQSVTATDTVSASMTGSAIINITPGAPSTSTSTITANPTSVTANGTATSTITVQLKDGSGNNLTASGGTVALSTTFGTLSSVTDNANGTYTATIKSSTIGSATISGTLNGNPLTSTATVSFVAGSSSAATSTITANPTTIIANGTSTSTITVQLKDASGNNLTSGGGNVTLATSRGTMSAVTNNHDGTFTATLTSSTTVGTATITGTLKGDALTHTATVTFVPGPASGATSTIAASPTSIAGNGTSTSAITVTLKDANGNSLTAGGDTVLLGTSLGSLSGVTDHGNGTYTAVLTSGTTAGVATISGMVNSVSIASTAQVTITFVPFGVPSNLTATALSASQVRVAWSGTGGVDHYEVYRASSGIGPYTLAGSSSGLTFIDSTVSAGTAYLYKVRAVDGGSSATGFSNLDVATAVAFTDDPLVAGVTTVKAVHVTELRTAINAVRSLAGLSPASFTDASLAGVFIKGVHITELRSALNPALSALGLPSISYTDATITTATPVRAAHVQELRNGVK